MNLVKYPEYLVWIDRSEREIVIRIPAIIKVKAAQHARVQQPGHNLFDILRRIVMTRIDQHLCLRTGLGRQQGVNFYTLNQANLTYAACRILGIAPKDLS